MNIDFGKTAQDYKNHRQGFPPSFFERLVALGMIGPNKRVLDIGTGTGTLARGAALAGSKVSAVDLSESLIEQAQLLDEAAGVQVDYQIAPTEQTGLPDASLDTVMAGQCWHWFDRPRAANEVNRLLVPGGMVVIVHLDWIPVPGNVVTATEQLILQHNPNWQGSGGSGLHADWLYDLAVGGFEAIETFSYDVDLIYTHEAWRGRIRASAGVAASFSPEAVQRFDRELAELLKQNFPEDPLPTHHRVWAVTARKPKS